jgi:type I restriction enzyme S subunit
VTLCEVAYVQSGGTPSKDKNEYWEGGTIIWLGSTVCKNQKYVSEITTYITDEGLKNSSAKLVPSQSTLIALVGATIGKTAFLPFEATVNQNIATLFPKNPDILDPSYLFYICGTLYERFVSLAAPKLAMANLSFVKNLIIPLPQLDLQLHLVSILDRFEAFTTDLTSGLPAEIEARRKQYEYYRDKLLTFKKAV